MRNNKSQWLLLAQNAQNNPHRTSSSSRATHYNNNCHHDEETNGGSDTPKIVGKLGKLNSQYIFPKQNGSILGLCDHSDETMDQQ